MKKRALALLLALVMMVSLVACNNNKPVETKPNEPNKPVETKPVETQPVETEPVKIEYPLVKEGEEVTLKGAVVVNSMPSIEDRLVWQAVEEVTGVNLEWEFVLKETINTYLNPYTSDIVTINVVQRSENYGK